MRATTIIVTMGRGWAIITGVAMATQRTVKGRVAVMIWVAEMPTILALPKRRKIRLNGA